jgi:hypothetical protein
MSRLLMLVAATAAVVLAAAGSVAIAQTSGAEEFSITLAGPGGTGTADLKLNPGGKVCYAIEVTLTTAGDVPAEPPGSGLGNAHIHVLPSGGIVVDLESTFTSLGGGTFVAAGCVRADRDVVRDILANPDDYYVNVHSVSFPDGAVSGTLA